MRRIGLRARFQPNGDCTDPSRGPAACLFGWGGSYAAFWVSVMFQPPSPDAVSYTAMGMTPRGMRSAGLTYRHTASIQPQYDTCAPALSVQQAPCWARLDQWLTDRVVAAVPVASSRRVRIVGDRVTHFSVDQFDLEVALNRTELAPSTR